MTLMALDAGHIDDMRVRELAEELRSNSLYPRFVVRLITHTSSPSRTRATACSIAATTQNQPKRPPSSRPNKNTRTTKIQPKRSKPIPLGLVTITRIGLANEL